MSRFSLRVCCVIVNLDNPILFFDGLCPFCNFTVRIVAKLDRKGSIFFSPIESPTGQEVLAHHPEMRNVDSAFILYLDEQGNERLAAKSSMIKSLARFIAWPEKFLLTPFIVVPGKLGDWVYDIISKNRTRFTGRYDVCPIPPKEIRDRMIAS